MRHKRQDGVAVEVFIHLYLCPRRLFILGSYDRETYVHCTLELSSQQWKEKTRSSIKRVGFGFYSFSQSVRKYSWLLHL